MTDKKQPDALRLAAEAWNFDCSKYRGVRSANAALMGMLQDCADIIRRLHAENETLQAGYAAARLEIESLRAPAGEYPPLPNRYYLVGGGRKVWDEDDMRAYVDADRAMRAAQPASERTPKDYAIEHAEYMAQDAERLLDAINHLNAQRDEGGDAIDSDALTHAEEAVTEAFGAVRNGIYEFRKRRDRAAAQPAGAQQPGAAYAALPGQEVPSYSDDALLMVRASELRAFADATHALRASHGQAPAQAAPATALAQLRHLYTNLKNGSVRDTAQAKRIADSLLGPVIESLERAQAAPAAVAGPIRDLHPEKCPITGRPFFMVIDHPELGDVPTYGGPFDSYTIPTPDGEPTDPWHERKLRCERFDHDAGYWVEGGELIPLRIVHEDVLFKLQEDALAAAPTTQPAPQQEAQEPVAVIGADFTIFWAGHGPIAPIVERHALKVGSPLYAAPQPSPTPQPTQAQAGAVPLTQAQVVEAFCKQPHPVQFVTAFDQGVRFSERHHGIKGGQHGADT